MRQWQVLPGTGGSGGAALAGMIRALGEPGFETAVLEQVQPWLPAASWSVYRTGACCRPTLFLSASRAVPDRTRDCWWAYLSGPYLHDCSFGDAPPAAGDRRLCHVLAEEMPAEHRERVYEAHGMVERVSVVDREDGTVFAVNFYRHQHQPAFTDTQIAAFEGVALSVLALAHKHILLSAPAPSAGRRAPEPTPAPVAPQAMPAGRMREQLLKIAPDLTPRELDVCVRLLQGLTHEGVASDLGLSCTTVKTYRNRAFSRLGVNFRNELFARVLGVGGL